MVSMFKDYGCPYYRSFLSGCEWHQRIKPAQNHFIYNDLPHFIMDSYEECREPPRVHLLDK